MSKMLRKLMAQELEKHFASLDSFIVFNYQGLRSNEQRELKSALRKQKISMRIIKNKVALQALKRFPKEISALFKGPTALAYGDAVTAAQALLDWNRKSPKKLEVRGGYIPGKVLKASEIDALAKVPPRPVLLGMLAGGFIAPLQQTASILVAPIQKMSYATTSLVKKMEDKKMEKAGS